ncbi:MAG: ATP-grasp domain-containing protein [Nitrospinota bacterium]
MARLLEHHSLGLLKRFGLLVPDYTVAGDPAAAARQAESLGGKAVLKALVPVGRRGKAGAVRLVQSPGEAEGAAREILGMVVHNFPVRRLLVSEALEVQQEYFLSVTFDSMANSPVVLFSAEGGVEVEELVAERPERLLSLPVDITEGLEVFGALDLCERAGLGGQEALGAARFAAGLYRLFRACDARLAEVNPLVRDARGRLVAGSAVVNLDEQALFRHRELAPLAGEEEGNGFRPLTPLERQMREIDALDPHVGAIRFSELEGDIGFMVSGGGSGLLSLGLLYKFGGRPATTFDITWGHYGRYEEKVYRAALAVLRKPGLKGLLLAGNVSNFARVDVRVAGIVRALKEAGLDYAEFPVVLRYTGPGAAVARELVKGVPGVEWHEDDFSLEDAVRRIVERAYGGLPGRDS